MATFINEDGVIVYESIRTKLPAGLTEDELLRGYAPPTKEKPCCSPPSCSSSQPD